MTKSPWVIQYVHCVDRNKHVFELVDQESNLIAELDMTEGNKVNLRLIQSAPELLEALELILSEFCKATPSILNSDQGIALHKASLAIRKARGES